MSILDIVAYSFLGLLSLASLSQLPKFWHHRSTHWDRPQGWWPYGEKAWQGWLRAMPSFMVGALVLVIIVVVASLAPDTPGGRFEKPTWIVIPSLVLFFGVLLVGISAAVFKRPRWVIAPYLRDKRS